ncbi:MAG: amidase [Paracoccaceae bacterium]
MRDIWRNMTAADLGREIGAGRIDPVELTEAFLAAIQASGEAPRIYARTTPGRALAEARSAALRAREGTRRGPLDGVPVSWKDLFDTAGVATEAGSAMLEGRTPARDAAVVRNAARAGLVCLGKTHMSELAFSGLGVNPVTETAPNINGPDLAPGGSSSGAAASVAFGLAAAGIGSDTGGSVRIPSAWNNLVGLKTTSGLLSREGVVPLVESLDTVGPLCRSVEDAALLLGALSGREAPDLGAASLAGKRLLVCDTVVLDDLEDAVADEFDRVLRAISRSGAAIAHRAIPEIPDILALSGPIMTVESYDQWREVIEAQPEKMFTQILERFRAGRDFSGLDYMRAFKTMRKLRRSYAARVAGFDAVVMPATPIGPPSVPRLLSDHDYYRRINLVALRNTRIGNLLGLCGLTVPTGVPACGFLLQCLPFTEAAMLRTGAAIEAAIS